MSNEFIVYSVSVALPKPILERVKLFVDGCPDPLKPLITQLMDECGLGLVENILAQFPHELAGTDGHTVEGLQVQFYGKPDQAFVHLNQLSIALQMVLNPNEMMKGEPKPFTEFFLKQGTPWCRIDMVILEDAPKEVTTKGGHARAFMDFVRLYPGKVSVVPCYISPDQKALDCDVIHLIKQIDSTAEEFELSMQHVFSKDFRNNGGRLN